MTAKASPKARATDAPSWAKAKQGTLNKNLTAQQNAKRLLNDKYGLGNWNKGGREFSEIVKWLQRGLGFK